MLLDSRLISGALSDSSSSTIPSISNPTTRELAGTMEDFVNWGDDELDSEPCFKNLIIEEPLYPTSMDCDLRIPSNTSLNVVYGEPAYAEPIPCLVERFSSVPFIPPSSSHSQQPAHVDPRILASHPYERKRSTGNKLKGTTAARATLRGISPARDSFHASSIALPQLVPPAKRNNRVPQDVVNEECEILNHLHNFPDATTYLRHRLGLAEWRPLNLSIVPDTEDRPSTGLWVLMALAIHASPYRMLPLQGIVEAISGSLQFYRNEKKWHNTVRHTLSLYNIFRLVNRPFGGGKGGYWRIDFTAGEGYKRARRRNPRTRAKKEWEESSSDTADDIALNRATPSRSPSPIAAVEAHQPVPIPPTLTVEPPRELTSAPTKSNTQVQSERPLPIGGTPGCIRTTRRTRASAAGATRSVADVAEASSQPRRVTRSSQRLSSR
ncbi:Forkhead box d1 [Mycena chlorophos]|uniref:Forkhead box d1 n=1 Tax=Mycena chlorophos TaxID=658473 RepID=A0A8H6WGT9_MYCCL|nr:Forkhead box d1 [Mycena chlorophos]